MGRRGRKRGTGIGTARGRGHGLNRQLPLALVPVPVSIVEAGEGEMPVPVSIIEAVEGEMAVPVSIIEVEEGENSDDSASERTGAGRGRKRGTVAGTARGLSRGRGRGRGRGHGRGSNTKLPLALVPVTEADEGENSNGFASERCGDGVTVSTFDYSVENHFRNIESISSLCGLDGDDSCGKDEIHRFSSTITFLVEWKHFYYKPKSIRFAYETGIPQVKEVLNGISLPQFSSATVPKMEGQSSNTRFVNSQKDFVLHVGGHIWALDWCPRLLQRPDCHIKCEYLAVAAHPPDSSYHKMGAPLTGRGAIQIWCIINVDVKEELTPSKPKRRGRKRLVRTEPLDNLSSSEGLNVNTVTASGDTEARLELEARNGNADGPITPLKRMKNTVMTRVCNNTGNPMLSIMNEDELSGAFLQENSNHEQVMMAPNKNVPPKGPLLACMTSSFLPNDVSLPRLMLCLCHNGKVAWDLKWRPSDANDPEHKHHMGYLAVLLGNGSLEVWEIPLPSMIKKLYSSFCKQGTDPRFVKLEPVFRCSKMKCGDRQSIPLTVEWSTSAPHDLLLVGCHDGTVSVLKFSARDSSQDTRPLLRFTADTVPIRALAWAPDERDAESANVIVTAGHEGLRFWDIRDPYRPLWDLNPLRKVVLSLDWLHDPRCVILSIDDGTMRLLSLSNAAHDVPVTGKSFAGTQQQGLHTYYGSPFSIWSIQASGLTGQVAYCGADGSAFCFQLTHKAVVKDPIRNRPPQFLCGSLTEEDSILTLNIPMPNTPLPMKKPRPQTPAAPKSKATPPDKANNGKERKDPSKTIAKNKTSDAMSLVGEEEEQENPHSGEDEMGNSKPGIEPFPPKIVAMHKVRWNMNKGSERWLCYGGAAGIIRCLEIDLSTAPSRPPRK
ncbi:uncharacterized protein LOC131234503 isoform X2 [Magnolia sinica]|uniref:uncharacterized protein LOC131234503 isoform X2 n=1 Tax=Magnolia sinica TaxID=86752 RepID=UPI0026585363|nr:uncharacterized protein LOC131234503 isoform X2 [Magnolia sinica]